MEIKDSTRPIQIVKESHKQSENIKLQTGNLVKLETRAQQLNLFLTLPANE